ncbi:hypothetical protein HHX38_06295 [Streptomyces sp. PKU-MA01144]|uniref:hypothetical protein n=1 Tax=Streptomyces sp. PKU-MA01144 TaxID=2729138 RepID=UPI000478260A|nr:hypothetical protein [Streptomyces sp. PKU-MA01144]MCY0982675.1 hypothetical protein [Streptomyces tirandamycinicus]NNJ03746.1 hypothetical protein [Streptomyces sp. PKU-MA01144]
MLRHEFRPGRLIAGAAVLATAAAYLGDATGTWRIPWFTALPVMSGGLALAAVATFVGYRLRRRRSAMAASSENTAAPASTSGSQATR